MRNFKKLLSIIFSLSIIFTMCTSNLRTFSISNDFNLEDSLNNLYCLCKDENNSEHLCKAKDLTYEKVSNMTLDEFKTKYRRRSHYYNNYNNYYMNKLYALSKLKSGEKHVTIHKGDKHYEYFRVSAIDEILNFFKTKLNYDQRDYEKDYKKDFIKNLCKNIGLYVLPCAAIEAGVAYYFCSAWKGKPKENKQSRDENCDKNSQNNSQTLSQKFKLICSGIMGIIGGAVGFLLGPSLVVTESVISKWDSQSKHRDAKDLAAYAFKKSEFDTDDYWTNNDVVMLKINMKDDWESFPYEYSNVGIGYSEDEQKTINEEYETMYKRVRAQY